MNMDNSTCQICNQAAQSNIVTCFECKHAFHWGCSRLPEYHIFLLRNSRFSYMCSNCIFRTKKSKNQSVADYELELQEISQISKEQIDLASIAQSPSSQVNTKANPSAESMIMSVDVLDSTSGSVILTDSSIESESSSNDGIVSTTNSDVDCSISSALHSTIPYSDSSVSRPTISLNQLPIETNVIVRLNDTICSDPLGPVVKSVVLQQKKNPVKVTSKSEDPVHDSDNGPSRKRMSKKKSGKNQISDKKKVILKSNPTGGPGRAVGSNLSSNITAGSSRKRIGDDFKPVCKFHLQGTCKYGCSGSDCKLDHPSLCRKFIRKGVNSCSRGDKCEFVHPKLCKSSLTKGSCSKKRCYLYHCTGSKRPNYKSSFSSNVEHNTHLKDSDQKFDRTSSSSLPSSKNNSVTDSFLAEVVELRKSIQTLQLQQLQLQNQFLSMFKAMNNNPWPQLGQISI